LGWCFFVVVFVLLLLLLLLLGEERWIVAVDHRGALEFHPMNALAVRLEE
jgi:hypothetical protein